MYVCMYNVLQLLLSLQLLQILSDFDASLELSPEGDLIPDSTHSHAHSYYTTHDRLYHISPVGTVGFKSPEGFMHVVSNSLEILPQLCTKADVFRYVLNTIQWNLSLWTPLKYGHLLLSQLWQFCTKLYP